MVSCDAGSYNEMAGGVRYVVLSPELKFTI
jgi:hypothetical protein